MQGYEYVWQLLRSYERRQHAEDASQYKFWKRHADYLETMAIQNGASVEMVDAAKRGDGFGLQALIEGGCGA